MLLLWYTTGDFLSQVPCSLGTIAHVQILQKSCPTPQFLPGNWKLFHNISNRCTLQWLHQGEKKHFKLALLSSTTSKGAFLLIKAIRHEICGSASSAIKCHHFTLPAEKGISSLFKENQIDIPWVAHENKIDAWVVVCSSCLFQQFQQWERKKGTLSPKQSLLTATEELLQHSYSNMPSQDLQSLFQPD